MEERPQVVLIATGRYRVDDLVEVEIGKERRRFELINGAVGGAVKKNAFEMLCRLRSSPDRALTSKSEVEAIIPDVRAKAGLIALLPKFTEYTRITY